LAGLQLDERGGIAAAERCGDSGVRQRAALALAVQIACDLVGAAAARSAAAARVLCARRRAPRRRAVLVLNLCLQVCRVRVHRCLHYIRVDECSRACYICQGEYMTKLSTIEALFKTLSDGTRLRILALL